jgi:hypothetical protein
MELMVCIDGVKHATVPLIDGNDPFNREAERGALDRAYEAKESNPDAVVSVVLSDWASDGPDEITSADMQSAADAISILRDLDEGEHTDDDELKRLVVLLRRAAQTEERFYATQNAELET